MERYDGESKSEREREGEREKSSETSGTSQKKEDKVERRKFDELCVWRPRQMFYVKIDWSQNSRLKFHEILMLYEHFLIAGWCWHKRREKNHNFFFQLLQPRVSRTNTHSESFGVQLSLISLWTAQRLFHLLVRCDWDNEHWTYAINKLLTVFIHMTRVNFIIFLPFLFSRNSWIEVFRSCLLFSKCETFSLLVENFSF